MKTEKEIRDEIKACEKTKENYRIAYKNGKIPKDVYKSEAIQCESMASALLWVLGENDRYD